MREIKFRGKRNQAFRNGEWVYGLPGYGSGGAINYICGWMGEDGAEKYEQVEVNPATVGEYTGLPDKNGKEIYEGDVVSWTRNEWVDLLDTDGYKEVTSIGSIVYRHHGFWVAEESFGWEGEKLWDWDRMEVIGNLWDNPELLTPVNK